MDKELSMEVAELLKELFQNIEVCFPEGRVPKGRNPAVNCIRLTLDPTKSERRPLIFYLVQNHSNLNLTR